MLSTFKELLRKCRRDLIRSCSTITIKESKGVNNVKTMKVLNVAEKNDAAKNIASLLGRGNCQRREGFSKFNKIYEFNCQVWDQNCQMVMTSVSGHLLTYEFPQNYRGWMNCHPSALFDAPVVKVCPKDYENIKRTLEREVRSCDALIIWTDCDREGENIGFEIIKVCQAIKPAIKVYRAIFSEITSASINRALRNLAVPNKLVSDAVDVRSELDLRIGAAFTRFQTLRLKKVFPNTLADLLISYGSCQFPTLGFVVERFLAIERFVSEPYWKIKVTDVRDDLAVEFRWARNRLFEKLPCEVYLNICQERPEATVEKVNSKPKSKWRPLPLDTVELEKQGSRKLRLNAKETMRVAEKLYSQGFISYPRTETNIFPKELNLTPLVTEQTQHPDWGNFAQRVLNEGITPRQGKKSDQAHPPIHPIKFTNSLSGNEAKVYEFVVRHFLACLSKNAEGHETIVDIDIAGEKFSATGLQIIAKNYLEVYIYEKWNAKEIHHYQMGQKFMPTEISMAEEKTSPPNLLTEADLIALMDKHGIGTDATHAEHIETIKSRHYVGMHDDKHLIPGNLGIGLVMGYDKMGFAMSKPNLRAELERDLKLICEGQKNPQDVLRYQIEKYREVFRIATEKANLIDTALANYLNEAPANSENVFGAMTPNPAIFKCQKCGADMTLRNKRQGNGHFIGCSSYPGCKNAIWFPDSIESVEVLDQTCHHCSRPTKKIAVKFQRANPQFGLNYETCISCDVIFQQFVGMSDDIRVSSNNQQSRRNDDSGYQSGQSTQTSNRTQSQRNSSTDRTSMQSSSRSNSSRPVARTNITSSNNRNNVTINSSSRPNNWNNIGPNRATSNSTNQPEQQWDRNIGVINRDTILCNCHQQAIELTVRKEGPNQGRQFFKCAKPQGEGCNFFLWKDQNPTATTSNGPYNPPPPPPPPSGGSNYSRNRNNNTRNVNQNQNQWNQPSTSGNSSNWSANDSTDETVICNCGEPVRNICHNFIECGKVSTQKTKNVICHTWPDGHKLTVQKDNANKGRQFYSCPKGLQSTCNYFKWVDEMQNESNRPSTSYGRGGSTQRGRGGSSQRKPRATGGKRKCGICGVEGHTKKTCPQNSMD